MSSQAQRTSNSEATGERRAHAGRAAEGGAAFLADLLRVQCRTAPAESGAMVHLSSGAPPRLIAAHPAMNGALPAWLNAAVQIIASRGMGHEGAGLIAVSDAGGPRDVAVLRLAGDPNAGGDLGFGLYLLPPRDVDPAVALERLGVSGALVELYGLRERAAAQADELGRRRRIIETAAATGAHERFAAAAFALVNGAASAWACERVALGVSRRGTVQLDAISHAEKIVRAADAARRLELAMEECLDQDEEIAWPAPADAAPIARAARDLAEHGRVAVVSIPLRREGSPFAALTLERAEERPFAPGEIEDLRLLADVVAGPLAVLHERGRSAGATLWNETKRLARAAVGPRHTGAKLAAAAALAFALFITFVHGERRIGATFRFEPSARRVIVAPFDGTIREVLVEPGASVAAGQALARLDDSELKLRLAGARADLALAERRTAVAQRERKEAEAQMARADADKARAEIGLLESRLARAALVAEAPGIVLRGDLRRMIGAPVREGETLFEVVPQGALRAEVFVPERDAAPLREGQRGELAAAAFPDQRIAFEIEHIAPAAEPIDGRVVVRARAALLDAREWMRPGMEGEARVAAGRARYASLWFGPAMDWLRLKLWW